MPLEEAWIVGVKGKKSRPAVSSFLQARGVKWQLWSQARLGGVFYE